MKKSFVFCLLIFIQLTAGLSQSLLKNQIYESEAHTLQLIFFNDGQYEYRYNYDAFDVQPIPAINPIDRGQYVKRGRKKYFLHSDPVNHAQSSTITSEMQLDSMKNLCIHINDSIRDAANNFYLTDVNMNHFTSFISYYVVRIIYASEYFDSVTAAKSIEILQKYPTGKNFYVRDSANKQAASEMIKVCRDIGIEVFNGRYQQSQLCYGNLCKFPEIPNHSIEAIEIEIISNNRSFLCVYPVRNPNSNSFELSIPEYAYYVLYNDRISHDGIVHVINAKMIKFNNRQFNKKVTR